MAHVDSEQVSDYKKILCVGLVCLDLVITVKSFPEEDEVTPGQDPHWQRGGNASNNCTALSLLDCPCELLATISRNDSGELNLEEAFYSKFILNDLKKMKIDYHAVFHDNAHTPISYVILNTQTGTRTIIHSNRGLPEVTFENFKQINLGDYCWIHFEVGPVVEFRGGFMRDINIKNFEGRSSDQAQMMKAVRKWNEKLPIDRQIPISFEMERRSIRYEQLAPLADFVFVGKELAQDRGLTTKEDAISQFWIELGEESTLIFPWGADGAAFRTGRDGEIKFVNAYPPANGILDTLAAGDTFIASSIFAMSRGHSVHSALDFGSRVAGAKIGMKGFEGFGHVGRNIYNEINKTVHVDK